MLKDKVFIFGVVQWSCKTVCSSLRRRAGYGFQELHKAFRETLSHSNFYRDLPGGHAYVFGTHDSRLTMPNALPGTQSRVLRRNALGT